MTVWIINQRTGGKTGPFDTYVEAAEFRKNVLRPTPGPEPAMPLRHPQRPATSAR